MTPKADRCHLSMRVYFKTILLLSLCLYTHAKRKEKRDISDLKADPVLSSVFASDVQAKRNDRSISALDESFNILNKVPQGFNSFQQNGQPSTEAASNNPAMDNTLPFIAPALDQSNSFLFDSQPMISNPLPVPSIEATAFQNDNNNLMEQRTAVDPALFASNYLPLPSNGIEQQLKFPVRRSSLPFYPYYGPYPWKQNKSEIETGYSMNIKLKDIISKHNINETKRANIPHPVDEKSALARNSSPLQLRIRSPNMKLRGIVPHVTEYGETVESIQQAQNDINYKRNFVPKQPMQQVPVQSFVKASPHIMYSDEIYKRNSIPHPHPQAHKNKFKRSNKPVVKKKSKKSNKKKSAKKSVKKSESTTKGDASKRQYVPQALISQQQMYPQFAPYITNYQQNPFSMQQSILQPAVQTYQQQSAAQVQNMDGLETRPIISSDPCADQYSTCVDFAKNNYCTNYPALMKIQCRKSCKYCVSPEDAKQEVISVRSVNDTAISNNSTTQSNNATSTTKVVDKTQASGSGSDSESGMESGSGSDDEVDTMDTVPLTKTITTKSANTTEVKGKPNVPSKPAKPVKPVDAKQVSSNPKVSINKPAVKPKSSKKSITSKSTSSSISSKRTIDPISIKKHDAESGSGASSESGDSETESGSGASNSQEGSSTNANIVVPSKIERNKIWLPNMPVKHIMGEFSLPVKKDVIPMPALNVLNMNLVQQTDSTSPASGSGSGSGSESGDESGAESGSNGEVKVTKANVVVADVKPVADVKKVGDTKPAVVKQPKVAVMAVDTKKNVTHMPVLAKKEKTKKKEVIKKKTKTAIQSKSKVPVETKPKAKAKAKKVEKKLSKQKAKKSKTKKASKTSTSKTTKDKKIVKKTAISSKPASLSSAYPRIDLKSIASALAHYEEAALELAGEYPKPGNNIDITEFQRSRIPRPNTREVGNVDRYKQNVEIAKLLQGERLKKENIPKFLKLSKDAKDSDSESADADNLDLVRQRFNIPGVEPTLNDYYAETGKLNPFASKQKKYKKSRIELDKRTKKAKYFRQDPYEYLRNMPPGASMEPIVDPRAKSTIPSDHSFPVFLMKVSPAEEKYLPEDASKRGKIHKLNAEGLPVSDKPKVSPHPAKAETHPHPFAEVPAPRQPVSYNHPPERMSAPYESSPNIYQQQQQQQAVLYEQQQQMNNYVEQNTQPQINQAFQRELEVGVEPPINSLRSKMLSAFFSVKNAVPSEEEGSGGGLEGSGNGIRDEKHDITATGSKKTVSLQSLLFNDGPSKQKEGKNWSEPPAQSANLRKLQDSAEVKSFTPDVSANYLQSNLDALTPESGGSNSLPSNMAAQFTTTMSKTQETNWVRPNAESELASAMPESTTSAEATQRTVPSIEMASLQQQPMADKQSKASLRDQVPKTPTSNNRKILSKSIMSADLFADQQLAKKSSVNNAQQSIRRKLINKNIFNIDVPKKKYTVPNIAVSSLLDKADQSLLTEFPKSPFSVKSNIDARINSLNRFSQQVPDNVYQAYAPMYPGLQLNYNPSYTKQQMISRNNIQLNNNVPPPSFSYNQYAPFTQANINPPKQYSNYQAMSAASPAMVHNEQASSLSAKIGAARYAISDQHKISDKPSQKQKDQYAGWDYLVQKPDSVKPLSMTTKDETPTISSKDVTSKEVVKNNSSAIKEKNESKTKETNESKKADKKNIIKQQPDLDCGSNWEGAEGDFGTFCYKEMKLKATFEEALKECRRLKADMFSILNAYENRYLQDNMHQNFWIGYRDKGMDGNWNWTDGSHSIYTNWLPSIFNEGSSSKSHDCVYIDGEEGEWKDESCMKKKPFLCKTKPDVCPKEWKNLKLNSATGCYKLYSDGQTWEEAEMMCRKHEAHLASVTSEDEQTMVFQVHSSKSFWIGFNDRESEGDWQWTDRSTSSYTNWADKSPDNGGVTCATMVEGGKWKDESCNEKNQFVCKRKGPKPEKNDGLDSDGVLLPVARLLNNADTAPSHVYDELSKTGPRPVVPLYFWPLLKTSKSGMAGNRPMAAHGDVRSVPGGVALDGVHSFLDGGDFHGKCLTEPDKCLKGFAIAIQVYFADNVRKYKKPHCVIDTSGGGTGFTIFIADNSLNYRVIGTDQTWELKTDLTAERWQELVMTWHKNKGISVYVNGAFKDSEAVGIKTKETGEGTARLIVGRESKEKGPYTCTKMVVASVAVFTKMLSVEDVPYAFTYGDTVVASFRWLMSGLTQDKNNNKIIQGAPEMQMRNSLTDVDGGIWIDGESGWLDINDFDTIFNDPAKSKHGFALSFKVKFDQRVREYKEPRYILDTGGHNGGIKGISVYLLNDNLYFQVVSTPGEDTMIWKVRTPIYTVRWQQVVITWRLDKGLWVYLDGSFRGFTTIPEALPGQTKESPQKFYIGRKIVGTPVAGAKFAFGCLATYTRFLTKDDTENVFGGIDNPFPGIIREVWKNTPGENLTALKANPDFPNNPTTIEIIENFDAPFNVENDYGSKLKGYFIAPETGNSTFYLSCSRSCELYFSSDEEAKNKTQIISLGKPTWHNQWNKYENQSSAEIFLVAGKYYYLEAIHKGVDASDSLSVGVRMPTGRYQRPISKENLQWRLPGNQHAGLIREVWYNVPGYTIADLTSNANFPNRPSSTEVLDKFDAPYNVDDNYGSRISGYFHAPETGDYRFYLSSDSSGELWISSDESETNLVKVVTLNGWTDHNQWLKYPEQKSDKIFLASNRFYYIRVYMKADKLGDCASVAVELPSGHFEGPIKKKHLSWKISTAKDGPGPDEIIEPTPKPIGLFALNDASVKSILSDGKKALILGDVDLTTGPGGIKDSAFLFKGNSSSYIEIPNDGALDAKNSITMLANIYPTGDDGPIINFKKDGWGVHLWQFSGTQLFVRFVTRDGHMSAQPLGTRVLELNKWNQVGASYDSSSGVAQLWHDGKMVKSRNIGQVKLLTNAPIRLGARDGDDRYFFGKISCIQIYDKALKEQQIGELRKCPKDITKGSQIQNDYDELTVFSQGSGMQPAFEDIEAIENRLGDDTEEELIVQGERKKATRCEPSPCENSGVCLDDDKKIDGYVCSCSSDFTGKRCQVSRPSAENPIVKRTEIPAAYEKKIGTEAYSSPKNETTKMNKKEDISLLYQKLGCYKDDLSSHDLKRKVKLQKVTQEHCAKSCALDDKGYSYFALQNGTSCYCGKNYGKYGKISEDECNIKCNGNDNENCGGEHANSVYFFGLGTNYTVKTFTGQKLGAGTDAKIYVEFIGERGSSDFRKLDDKLERYESGRMDKQTFLLPDLGKLKRMKILHDNTGTAPSWYLDKIQVTDEDDGSYEFDCNDWLSDTQSGGKLERELQARSIIPNTT